MCNHDNAFRTADECYDALFNASRICPELGFGFGFGVPGVRLFALALPLAAFTLAKTSLKQVKELFSE